MKNCMSFSVYLSLFLLLSFSNSMKAIEPTDTTRVYSTRSCVNTFENQTVSSVRSVTGCDSLIVRGVTIANTGNLTLAAPEYVVLHGSFEVLLGGVLSINEKEEPLVFEFTYGAAGNRTLRRAKAVQ